MNARNLFKLSFKPSTQIIPSQADRFFVFWAGLIVSMIGLTVAVAWLVNLRILLTIFPRLASMKFNTALSFLLCGLFLLLISYNIAEKSLVGYILPVGVLLICGATLFAYDIEADFFFDEFFVKDPYTALDAYPGRMSPGTAFNFVLIAISLIMYRHYRRPAEVLAVIAHLIALAAVLGYLFDFGSLYRVTFFSTMAIHTALSFMLLSIGVIFAIPDGVIQTLLSRNNPSGTAVRYLLPAALIVPVACGWVVWKGYVQQQYNFGFATTLLTMLTIVIMSLFALAYAMVAHRWYERDKQNQRQLLDSQLALVQMEQEREMVALKERFLAMLSHDIRSPLTSIILSSDLLMTYEKRMDANRRLNHLSKIRYQAHSMIDLVEDIMLLTKLESQTLPFEPTKGDFVDFCKTHFQEFTQLESDKPHSFVLEAEIENIVMSFDPHLLKRLLNNILRNAVKYSPDGGTISLSVTRNDDHALLTISDTGIGIPEEHLSKLFQLFSRANNVGNLPGYGLGLAIVKQIVELHQGTIEVESTEGECTSFTFSFPLTVDR